MADRIDQTDSLLAFRNSQGQVGLGTLMALSRQAVVFEVYNPFSIVQLSEVLEDLRINRGDRTIYRGRAVVGNLVSTGLMLIVSATLVDPWQDLANLLPGEQLRGEVRSFVDDWRRSHEAISPGYRLAVDAARDFLEELSQWLTQGETAAGITVRTTPRTLINQFTGDVESGSLPQLHELFAAFEHEAAKVEPQVAAQHKSYARRELHPLLLCSPFIHRTYSKPLGYAGDYEMVNMMCRDRWEGSNTYARVVNSIVIESDGARSHRNRLERLTATIEAEALRVASGKPPRRLKVLNIGCGPAVEIQRFVRSSPVADQVDFHLMDFNNETLDYARSRIGEAVAASGRLPGLDFIHRSINDLLKDARTGTAGGSETYDLVYCAGLFDYLSDRICQRLMELFAHWTALGGLIIATNVHPRNPVRHFIEHLLEWNLIYRDESEMMRLRPLARGVPRVDCEATGVNVFLEVRMPEHAP